MPPSAEDPDRGPGFVALCIVMIILSTVAVALRLWSRSMLKGQRYWWDDWTAVASLPVVLTTLAILLQSVRHGYGQHTIEVPPAEMAKARKYLYALNFTFDTGITLPKYSAILFYIRVFRLESRWFRRSVFVGFGLVTVWLISTVFSTIFECNPVRKAWLPSSPGHCINNYQWILGRVITSVIIDCYLTIVPIPAIWKIHTGRTRKVFLTGFFFCAYCVLVVSLGRLAVIVQIGKTFDADFTWNSVPYFRWIATEGTVSIISICLPSMNHLFQRARHHGPRALFTRREYVLNSSNRTKTAPNPGLVRGRSGFSRIGNNGLLLSADDQWSNKHGGMYSVSATAPQTSEGRDIALGEVHMRHEINVTEDDGWA